MTTTSSISSILASSTSSTTSTTSTSSSDDANEFLLLLIEQMQNQDPLEPMDSSDMMSQLCQLESLTAMLDIQSTMEDISTQETKSYAASLVGKYVYALPDSSDSSDYVFGTVDSIYIDDDTVSLIIGEDEVDLSSIVQVFDASS